MKGFSGFPDGALVPIPIPALFFTEILPIVDHIGELQLLLFSFWSLQSQEGSHRYLRLSQLAKEEALLMTLAAAQAGDPQALLREALERAVARGVLLHVTVTLKTGNDEFYFMNTEKGRLLVDLIHKEEWLPEESDKPLQLVVQRPNIFLLFEQNIGPLTPLIADQLRDLEKDYSTQWVEDAIKQAAYNRVTSLNYIIGILRRWQRDGRPAQSTSSRAGESSS